MAKNASAKPSAGGATTIAKSHVIGYYRMLSKVPLVNFQKGGL
jgi:hypothetical protein